MAYPPTQYTSANKENLAPVNILAPQPRVPVHASMLAPTNAESWMSICNTLKPEIVQDVLASMVESNLPNEATAAIQPFSFPTLSSCTSLSLDALPVAFALSEPCLMAWCFDDAWLDRNMHLTR